MADNTTPKTKKGKKGGGSFLTQKVAGASLWVWLTGGVAAVYLYRKTQGNTTATSTTSGTAAVQPYDTSGAGSYYGGYGSDSTGTPSITITDPSPPTGVAPHGPTKGTTSGHLGATSQKGSGYYTKGGFTYKGKKFQWLPNASAVKAAMANKQKVYYEAAPGVAVATDNPGALKPGTPIYLQG